MALATWLMIVLYSGSLLLLLGALFFSVLIFQQYRNLPSIRIVIIAIFLVLWLSLVFYIDLSLRIPSLPQPPDFLAKLALLLLISAFSILSYMQINIIFDRKTRLMGLLALSGFNFSFAYLLSDLVGPTNFYQISVIDQTLTLTMTPAISLVMMGSAIFLILSFYLSFQQVQHLPEYLISSRSITVLRLGALTVIVLGSVLILSFIILDGMIQPPSVG